MTRPRTSAAALSLKLQPNPPAKGPGEVDLLTETKDFGPNPGDLRMLMYLPKELAAGSPLVVVLHGSTMTAQAYAEGAGWLALAQRFGFALLCPEQTSANNANLSFNWFQPWDSAREGGEATSIHQMIGQAIETHDLDAKRVFVTGLSAGGAMTAVMLATYPEVFAAGGIIAGLPYGAACNVWEALTAMFQENGGSDHEWGEKVRAASSNPGPWPCVSIWHGESDTTVRPGAGEDLVSQWTNVHGVGNRPGVAKSGDGRTYRVWRSANGQTMVKHHSIRGMAHGTPLSTKGVDGCGTAGPYLLEVGISSSLEIAKSWGVNLPPSPKSKAIGAAIPLGWIRSKLTLAAAAVRTPQ